MDEGLEAGDRGKKEGLAKQLCGSVMLDKRDSVDPCLLGTVTELSLHSAFSVGQAGVSKLHL